MAGHGAGIFEALQRGGVAGIAQNLHDQIAAPTPLVRDSVDLDYVREVGEPIFAFPSVLDEPRDRSARNYVIVAIDSTGTTGYFWDYNEAENREHNCRRMRNGMNLSAFEDCDFYFVNSPSDPLPPTAIGGGWPACDGRLYAPLRANLAKNR
jgi:hypothetical protein